ncbi:hypothetical protein AGMMS49960_18220 [Betaproteobacteria bacterium]|nr:hypothetical protein AGMMS49543_22910 [Betaproteobacteria bacterium]GHU03601.1 hypothetical protein AGMMS49960_18220 [Betaproteobacteria bacterium]GHU11787.1 hypothetical protein AGMMS50225_18100 [Betaproteobacteria bacterium]GHU23346.1 hypothetical protein AGMMS50243_24600 [Betaproteobacteria bacterium]
MGIHETEDNKQQIHGSEAPKVAIDILSDEPMNSSRALYHYPKNAFFRVKNCARNVELGNRKDELTEYATRASRSMTPFRVGTKVFYIKDFKKYGICTASHVYLMHTKDRGTGSNLKMEIEVEKREMPSFRRVWAGTVTINGVSKLEDVDVDDDDQSLLTLTLSNDRKDGDKALKKVKLKTQK